MTDLRGEQVALTLAAHVKQAIIDIGNYSERSLQSRNHVLGVSDIGGCREFVRRMILDEPFSDEKNDYALASLVGHAVGEYLERGLAGTFKSRTDTQVTVQIELPTAMGGVVLTGHADMVTEGMVVDFKTTNGLAVVRKGIKQQHKWQVSLYCEALIQMGRLPKDAMCVLIYLDRSGVELEPHVVAWQHDPDILIEIEDWINDVLYAISVGEEASRDKPREFCWAACPYVSACRGPDTDIVGLIADEEQVLAVKAYVDAQGREKQAKRDRESAAAALAGVVGSTGEWAVRWVNVPAGRVEAFNRAAYQKLSITPVKARSKE